VRGRITARDALALVEPLAREASANPALVIITSGTSIDAEGRANTWEFVYRLPDRAAGAVYSFEPVDPEANDGILRLKWRISPGANAGAADAALPAEFVDSPEAAGALGAMGVDWISGDPDLTLATKRLPTGQVVWFVESYGKEYTIPFVSPPR
jgi:hypothetical protein